MKYQPAPSHRSEFSYPKQTATTRVEPSKSKPRAQGNQEIASNSQAAKHVSRAGPAPSSHSSKSPVQQTRKFWTQAIVPHSSSKIVRISSALRLLRVEQSKNISKARTKSRVRVLPATTAPATRNTKASPKICAVRIPRGESKKSGLPLDFLHGGEHVFQSLLASTAQKFRPLSKKHKVMIPRTFAPKEGIVKKSPMICKVAIPMGFNKSSGLALEFLKDGESLFSIFNQGGKSISRSSSPAKRDPIVRKPVVQQNQIVRKPVQRDPIVRNAPEKAVKQSTSWTIAIKPKHGQPTRINKDPVHDPSTLSHTFAPFSKKVLTAPQKCQVPIPKPDSYRCGLTLDFLSPGEQILNHLRSVRSEKHQAETFAPVVEHVRSSPRKCPVGIPIGTFKTSGLGLQFLKANETIFESLFNAPVAKKSHKSNGIKHQSGGSKQRNVKLSAAHTWASPTRLTKSSPRVCLLPTPTGYGPGLTLSFLKPNETLEFPTTSKLAKSHHVMAQTSAPSTHKARQQPPLCHLQFPIGLSPKSGLSLKYLHKDECVFGGLFRQPISGSVGKRYGMGKVVGERMVPRMQSERPQSSADAKHKIFSQKERFRI